MSSSTITDIETGTAGEAQSGSPASRVTAKQVCIFLAEYAEVLLACGATCIRLDRNVRRMAEAFGKRVEITILPRHIHMTVCQPGSDDFFTSIATVRNIPISFSLNTKLSTLSWNVVDENLSLREAERRFHKISASDHENPWRTLWLASLANASFCGIFGGDAVAMAIVFIATVVGFFLKQQLCRRKMDVRVVFFLCAFISSVIGCADFVFPTGTTPAIALSTSVLYLVPGIPFLNSFSDLLYRHYICAYSRFTDALVLTACLSLGLLLGMRLMGVRLF